MNQIEAKDNQNPIHVAIIATYPEMTRNLFLMAEKAGVVVDDYYASFNEAVAVARRIQHQVDAILSRGGTGQYVREAVKIPVISIPITPFDLAQSVERLPRDVKEIAFINFARNIYGVRSIEASYGVKIHELTFRNKNDIERGIRRMKAQGVGTIIGGNVAAIYARQEGLTGIEITSGEEAIYRALHEAIDLVLATREERKKAQRLHVAFDSIAEGIVISDEKKKIFVCNTAARNLFGLGDESVLGKRVDDLILDRRVEVTFNTKKAERNHLFNIRNTTANVNHIPIDLDGKFIGVVSTMEDVTKIQNLEGQIRNKLNEKGFYAKHTFSDIVTRNPNLLQLKEIAELYAATKSTILIEGESGTGKELFAQSLHNASGCKSGPFVAVNCAAIPEQLLESELFGYEGGAFTGAKKEGKPGLFEMANNGTIFLDEIGEIPKMLQARLLRVLQEKEIMRVGGNKMMPVNVRIIGATNRNLREKVRSNEFREDLYYRLNVFNIKVPSLRERKEDIELLCNTFMEEWRPRPGENEKTLFYEEILPELKLYDWPGNIRELRNIMERLEFFLNGKTQRLNWRDLIKEIQPGIHGKDAGLGDISLRISISRDLKETVGLVEKEIIQNVLALSGGNQELAASKLGIGKTTLWRKLSSHEKNQGEKEETDAGEKDLFI